MTLQEVFDSLPANGDMQRLFVPIWFHDRDNVLVAISDFERNSLLAGLRDADNEHPYSRSREKCACVIFQRQ